MDLGLEGKVAVVTGTAYPKGNGRAIALTLAKEGASIGCADINVDRAEAIAEEIVKLGRKAIAVKVDQGDYDQVKEAVTKISQELGPIDILVNNAAMMGNFNRITKMEVSSWLKELNVNLSGPYYWTRETFNFMAEKKWGRIISISSLAGLLGGFGQCSYASSKIGLVGLMRTAALEGARLGITANVVALGPIATDAFENLKADVQEQIRNRIPRRILGEPNDVANIVTFLASEKAGYINGATIVVDGGVSLAAS